MPLAIADASIGRAAITSAVSNPATLMMGTHSMMVLIGVTAAIVIGDAAVLGVGAGAALDCATSLTFFWIAPRTRATRHG